MFQPDELDLRILALYCENTRLSAEYIGSKVGLSASAVQRRIKQLRARGVITHDIALTHLDALGLQMQFVINVNLHNDSTAQIAAFEQKMLGQAAVLQCYYVTGSTDFIVIAALKNVAEFDNFTSQNLMNDANVSSFTSHLVIRRTKFALSGLPQSE